MTLTPLITADEAFPAFERLAAGAREELMMSFRIFDPATKLRAPELRERGLDTWADLLTWVVRRGVRLRLIIADFDPLLAQSLHRLAWRSASGFADVIVGDVQILCAPHGQAAGRLWHLAMRARLRKTLSALRASDPTRLTPVQRDILETAPVLRPVTIHQKFALADGTRSIVGGIDINQRRFDTEKHDQSPEETWHDVSMSVEDADFSGALRGHFVDTWNAALICGAPSLAERALPIDMPTRPQAPPDLRLIRTVSAPCPGLTRLGPTPRITDHEKTVLSLIGEAREHIYIETQFLRHKPVADALVAAAARAPDLQLVVVLPPAPERILFDGDDGWDARHAHGLQFRALRRIAAAFGDRAALISPAQPWAAGRDAPALKGGGTVYVHAKVLLIDDAVGLVGSANLNGRSLRWDTEASVLFRRPDTVAALRKRLAEKWLGEDAPGDTAKAATWRQAALANMAKEPGTRTGFVMPFPMESADRFSKRLPFLPDDMF
ncbi:phospholipase D family protein [Aestuariicoccus sp. MJ-SS9]|uniref:phospholipase D family protein n=1 Tax=Aestuariicoccus sp. MJ-SS9 TaxID=3079855 RepID=UPI002911BCF8|nr:phospholipase D family protein [Aestuariicoccus sp. MJ-SS9]MDU8912911.1 phospholipase D family protein [Aestuariicoccus sp. MJ-SS9]